MCFGFLDTTSKVAIRVESIGTRGDRSINDRVMIVLMSAFRFQKNQNENKRKQEEEREENDENIKEKIVK